MKKHAAAVSPCAVWRVCGGRVSQEDAQLQRGSSGVVPLESGSMAFGILQLIPTHKHACSCKKICHNRKDNTISMSISFNIIYHFGYFRLFSTQMVESAHPGVWPWSPTKSFVPKAFVGRKRWELSKCVVYNSMRIFGMCRGL